MAGTEHLVVKSIDVIPHGERSRAQLVVQTEEGKTVVLYLKEKDEGTLQRDATLYLG